MNIYGWLREHGYDTLDESYYSYIDLWREWYLGEVPAFHSYKVFNGVSSVTCKRYKLSMANKVCNDWANLLLNEKVKINHPDQRTQEYIIAQLDANRFWVRGNQAQCDKMWAGLVAYVPYPKNVTVDEQTGRILGADGITINISCGRGIIPLTVKNGECTECAFCTDTKKGDKRYTLLQICRKDTDGTYLFENKLFDTTNSQCKEVALNTVDRYADVVPVFRTGLTEPPFVLDKPNLPNPIDPNGAFGVAVFASAIDVLKGIDSIYDAYINEYTLGKKRIVASAETVHTSVKNPDGTYTRLEHPVFDPNDVIFYQLPGGIKQDSSFVTPIDMSIRAEEMKSGLHDNINLLSTKCGFGENHYRFDSAGVTTATQIVSENSTLFRTLKKHEIILDDALKRLCRLIVQYGKLISGLPLDDSSDVTIDFDDSIIEDRQSQNNDMRADVAAGILRPEYYIMKKYGVSEKEAQEMIPEAGPLPSVI